jgi:hypothetical protein
MDRISRTYRVTPAWKDTRPTRIGAGFTDITDEPVGRDPGL